MKFTQTMPLVPNMEPLSLKSEPEEVENELSVIKEEPELLLDTDLDLSEDHANIIVEHTRDKIFVLINEDGLSEFEEETGEDPLTGFFESSEITSHVSEEPGKTKKIHFCNMCGYASNRKERIKIHARRHTGEKPYQCPQCPFRAAEKPNMNRHISTHSQLKPFRCQKEGCDYSTNSQSYIQIHERLHTNEKPYACNLCDYKTAIQSHLGVHRRRKHSTGKKIKCTHCSYTTSVIEDLRVHNLRHSGEKRHACPHCPYKAYLKSALKVHMQKHSKQSN